MFRANIIIKILYDSSFFNQVLFCRPRNNCDIDIDIECSDREDDNRHSSGLHLYVPVLPLVHLSDNLLVMILYLNNKIFILFYYLLHKEFSIFPVKSSHVLKYMYDVFDLFN